MERKNTILLTVIAVATLLVAVVGATFAYFVASGQVENTSTVNITTSAVDSVTGASTDCSLAITSADMTISAADDNGTPINHDNECTLSIIATKDPNNSDPTVCTYDVVYTPVIANDEVTGDPITIAVPRSSGNTENVPEATMKAADSVTTGGTSVVPNASASNKFDYASNGHATQANSKGWDLYNISAATTVIDDATFTFTASSTLTWTFTPYFYNYTFDQSSLADKSFSGIFSITNLVCTAQAASPSSGD